VQRGCATIVEDLFVPKLELQEVIKQVDPDFYRCSLSWPGGVLDPPIALRPTTVVDVPTIAAFTTTAASTESMESTGNSAVPIPAGRVEQPLPSQTISAQFLPESPRGDPVPDVDHGREIGPDLIASAIFGSDMQSINLKGHGVSTVIMASQTLSIGGPAAKIAGQVVSLAPQGLVIGATTISFPPYTTALLIAGETVAVKDFHDGIVVGSFSLRSGAQGIVVKNRTISLSGTNLLVDGTITFARTVTKNEESHESIGDKPETSHDVLGIGSNSVGDTSGAFSRNKSEAHIHCLTDLCLMWSALRLAVIFMVFW
jgi:hypothetical protein